MADNIAIVEGAYEALANGDINTFIDALDEQIEWHLPEHHPMARQGIGRAAGRRGGSPGAGFSSI
ncbi:MAG: hypothetical protein LC644_11445 [Pseudonocardia sp.]|nr:hypothetical protein [Pseudonocardia sp.]